MFIDFGLNLLSNWFLVWCIIFFDLILFWLYIEALHDASVTSLQPVSLMINMQDNLSNQPYRVVFYCGHQVMKPSFHKILGSSSQKNVIVSPLIFVSASVFLFGVLVLICFSLLLINNFILRCKSYEKAKKKLTVSEAPNVLTVALKRFQVFHALNSKTICYFKCILCILYAAFLICYICIAVWEIWEAQQAYSISWNT